MQKIQRFRFILLTLFIAAGTALAGGMLIYLAVHAWQTGEFHSRGRILRPSNNPIEFSIITALGSIFGAALLCASPAIIFKVLASDAAKIEFIANNPKLYGKTRPSLLWLLMALLALAGYSLL